MNSQSCSNKNRTDHPCEGGGGKRCSGHRPSFCMKYGYLHQAHQPSTGKTFGMHLPNMSGGCFRLFIKSFAETHPGQMMIMDNAGCHHVKWDDANPMPDISIEHLPPYSPELNPQERFFGKLRKPLKGRFYEYLSEIEEAITESLKEYWKDPEKVKRPTGWEWVV